MGDYFAAQGIPILRGRAFTAADREDAPLVAIVNRTLAQHYWPGQDPLGKRLHRGTQEANLPWLTVVGEIGDVKQLAADAPTAEQIYIPAAQVKPGAGDFAGRDFLTGWAGSLVIRGQVPPEQMIDAVRGAVRSIDPQLPLTQVQSMQQVVEAGEGPRRFETALISAFAAAALLLAFLGIYGVIAFSALLRTQEMAIRMALGSPRLSIVQLVLASGARLGLIGCALGGVGAFFATRLLRSFLFQVDATDPAILALSVISIFLLAVTASLLPARRAALVDPNQALRAD
jgi:FtsX-like permease family/MacB-like periplasmic core domain